MVFSKDYTFHWPGHVFPTGKYVRLAERLRDAGLADGFHESAIVRSFTAIELTVGYLLFRPLLLGVFL